jgi:hypothetical protein
MKPVWFGLSVSITVISAATPGHADRASLLPVIFRACQNTLSSQSGQAARLSAAGVTVNEVCQCQAPLFVSHLSDAQLAEFTPSQMHVSQPTTDQFMLAIGFCGSRLMILKSH